MYLSCPAAGRAFLFAFHAFAVIARAEGNNCLNRLFQSAAQQRMNKSHGACRQWLHISDGCLFTLCVQIIVEALNLIELEL